MNAEDSEVRKEELMRLLALFIDESPEELSTVNKLPCQFRRHLHILSDIKFLAGSPKKYRLTEFAIEAIKDSAELSERFTDFQHVREVEISDNVIEPATVRAAYHL